MTASSSRCSTRARALPCSCSTASRTRASLWRHQIPALDRRRVSGSIAPDLRGFGESDKPAEVERVPRRPQRRRHGRDARRAGDRAGARRRPRLGRRRRLGDGADGAASASTGSWCCRSATRARGTARSSSARSLVHAALPVPGGRGDPAPRRLGAAARVGGDAPGARGALETSGRALTAGAELVPGEPAPARELDPPRALPPVQAPTRSGCGAAATSTCSSTR